MALHFRVVSLVYSFEPLCLSELVALSLKAVFLDLQRLDEFPRINPEKRKSEDGFSSSEFLQPVTMRLKSNGLIMPASFIGSSTSASSSIALLPSEPLRIS